MQKKVDENFRKNQIKAVLFDLDGVLVDSADAWFLVFNDSLENLGFMKISRKEFSKEFVSPIEQDIMRFFHGKSVEGVEHAYDKNFFKRINHVRLIMGAQTDLK